MKKGKRRGRGKLEMSVILAKQKDVFTLLLFLKEDYRP
jgi:hypothetical protein